MCFNEAPTLNTINAPYVDDNNNKIINIQLPYDLNSPMEPELWDSTFHSISLHNSLKYLHSDSKNIKKSQTCLAKNKKINLDKSNNIKDFKDIGETT